MFIFLFKLLMKMFFTVKKWPQSDFTDKILPSFYFDAFIFHLFIQSMSIKQSSVDTLKRKGTLLENEGSLFQKKLQIEYSVDEWEVCGLCKGKGRQRSGVPGRAFLYKVQQKDGLFEMMSSGSGCTLQRGQEDFCCLGKWMTEGILSHTPKIWVEWIIYNTL